MSQYKSGQKVRNKLTGEIATVCKQPTKEVWVNRRGYVTKVQVENGNNSLPNQIKVWMPTSVEILEEAAPQAFIRYNALVRRVREFRDNNLERVSSDYPDMNTECTCIFEGKLNKESASLGYNTLIKNAAFPIIIALAVHYDLISRIEAAILLDEITRIVFESKK